jgi:tryptophan synthase alpha chain
VRAISDLPIAVGFGVSTHAQVAEVWRYADAAVVGSALVAEIERLAGVPDMVKQVGQLVRELIPAPDPSLAARDLEQNLEAALPPPVR